MKIPQIPPLPGCTPLGFKIINGDSTRKQSAELFDAPFNLRGEVLTSEIDAEGEARVRALAESEARKAQTCWPFRLAGEKVYPLHDDTNENAL